MRRILVTGAATWSGGELISRLEEEEDLEVIAVDEIPPRAELESPFHRYELDNPEFAHFVIDSKPETLVHLQTVDRSAMLGGRRAHDEAVVGAQALFGAIRRCQSIRHVVVRSHLCVYGMGPRSPSVVVEDADLDGRRSRFANDLRTVEGFTSDAARVRQDVTFTILRFAPIFGPDVNNPLSRYLRLPVVPTRLGYDPRIQLISGEDAVGALAHTIDQPQSGVFNIAASGQLFLSRILRLGKRLAQPLPRRAYDAAVRGMSRFDLDLPEDIKRLVHHGMVADTRRMSDVLQFTPELNLRATVLNGYGSLGGGVEVR
ncbi:MAG: NAD-dependent epimerase/dehydratase family protein [Acidimicrobiia bacterium]|nr:NAD-dependent epimerase/dehydratase family protein [Acidimicrobiia bacterium]